MTKQPPATIAPRFAGDARAAEHMIVASGVSKGFGGVKAVDDLSFAVAGGEVVGLLGPNGSGKTTMIRLLNGLLRPDRGQVRVLGLDPLHEGDAVRRACGVLTESAEFYGHMSALENLSFFAALYGVTEPSRPGELLATFGLDSVKAKPVAAFSTGMRKRLGLAKALLNRPAVLFLDEPTNGLDPEGTHLVLNAIRDLQARSGTTILICSHLLQQLEIVCQRYLFVNRGRLLEQGTLAELRAKYQPTTVLRVTTDLPLAEGQSEYRGAPVRVLDDVPPGTLAGQAGVRRLGFELAATALVPEFLKSVVQDARVFGAVVEEPSLETLYFEVQGEEGGGS